jgi:hypothetical protein
MKEDQYLAMRIDPINYIKVERKNAELKSLAAKVVSKINYWSF